MYEALQECNLLREITNLLIELFLLGVKKKKILQASKFSLAALAGKEI